MGTEGLCGVLVPPAGDSWGHPRAGAGAGGAEPRTTREQAEVLEPAFQAVLLWLHSRFPSCFSAFPVLGVFFFSPSGGKCHIAEQVEDLFVCIFWGAGKDTSNQTPS